MLFKAYNIEMFLKELSSDAPSPGGGSTAALVSALSGALNSMVYSLTIGKKMFESLSMENKEKMMEFNKKANDFIKNSKEFMEKDRRDFLELMNSYKMPKSTDEEIIIRKNKIKECTIKAMETPLNLAKECLGFYDNIAFAVEYGNKNLVSDAGVAAILLHSAIESALINVKVNLNSLRNDDKFLNLEDECNEILNNSISRKTYLLNIVGELIYPAK